MLITFDPARSQHNNQMMDDRSNTPMSPVTAESTAPAPNWDHVPFEVGCARCGHDLHGRSEPKCPACDLEFDWADAVPIERLKCLHCGYHLYGLTETRCPECGEGFVWDEVLDDYHRHRKPLFEYRWAKEPLQSLRSSSRMAMRPWRLWRFIEIHDPPAKTGLIILLVITAILSSLSIFVFAYVAHWTLAWIDSYPQKPWADPGGGFWPAWGGGYPLLRTASPWNFRMDWYPGWLGLMACWAGATFGALLIFRQSMTRCRVRTGHVFRVWVYALLPIPVGQTIFCLINICADIITMLNLASLSRIAPVLALWICIAIAVATWFWTFLSIALGYRLYMKMDHAWVVAFSAQLIALLFTSCAATFPALLWSLYS